MEMNSFYNCRSSGDEVLSSSPVTFDKDTAISVAQQILREPKDFIGFTDFYGTTIQFHFDESGEIWVEIPFPQKGGSYGKHISLYDVENFIKELPETFTKECIPNGRFEAW